MEAKNNKLVNTIDIAFSLNNLKKKLNEPTINNCIGCMVTAFAQAIWFKELKHAEIMRGRALNIFNLLSDGEKEIVETQLPEYYKLMQTKARAWETNEVETLLNNQEMYLSK